jgi:arylsulfatase A-like enzyme
MAGSILQVINNENKNKCMKKSIFYLSCMLFLALGSISCSRQDELPNIIFVLADDMGYGDVAALNPDGKIRTPHLDGMVAEGMVFADAHTTSAVCTPTRYGIITGRYNWRSALKRGVLNGYSPALIDTGRETTASMLQKAGYYTAFIGKWHLGWDWAEDETGKVDFSKPLTYSPNDAGFDFSYGHSASLDMPPYVYVENKQPTAIPDSIIPAREGYPFLREGPLAPDFLMEDVTPNFFRRAIELVKDRAGREDPFFLYLALPSPHTPILPTAEWQGRSRINPYADFVMMIDDYMGKLLESIEASGIEENTIVFFASDNGCSPMANFDVLLEHGHDPSFLFRGHKADIYEGGHRVPFIVKWPARINPGTRSGKTICTADLMATCADIAGFDLPHNAAEDSYSLLPLFDDPASAKYLREYTVHHSISGRFAIRQGDWKLCLCPGSAGWSYPTDQDLETMEGIPPMQLFNLRDDIGEQQNLYGSNPEKVEELKAALKVIIFDGCSTPGEKQTNENPDNWPQLGILETD